MCVHGMVSTMLVVTGRDWLEEESFGPASGAAGAVRGKARTEKSEAGWFVWPWAQYSERAANRVRISNRGGPPAFAPVVLFGPDFILRSAHWPLSR